ncbi:uncharacterized protein LY89DRAFT_681812 [Mollisia scopiformis]|uniref:Uncharacterized protein n=1 Tax=Mollisia scopiformis TaxID=149040 RepID=A0A194XM22_MOLSC|nr:uncharacterized protein LY89DRAFT_681812 [Mollisia scopiformis]KUJ21228.1 hypothetical protein LY89DRAFT_681812 [Mollisia scopiformis]
MSDDARKSPKFSWDYDIPNDAFWNSIEYSAARNFLQCYKESEISKMHFDNKLSLPAKYKLMRQYLDKTFKEKEEEVAPAPLLDANYPVWLQLKLAMSTMEYYLEDYNEQERLAREMYECAPNDNKKMSALHQLSGILEKTKRYADAERMAKKVLPWLQGHELLGKDSPQALSCVRTIASSIWKQKKYKEGGEWMDQYGMLVGSMKDGKFEKYRDTEMKLYVEAKRALWEWRREQGDA